MARSISSGNYLSCGSQVSGLPASAASRLKVKSASAYNYGISLCRASGGTVQGRHCTWLDVAYPRGGAFSIADNGVPVAVAGVAGGTANAWAHVAGVFASATSRLGYKDGTSASNTDNVGSFALSTMFVGTSRYNGIIDSGMGPADVSECALWSESLAAQEVAALAAQMCPMLVRPAAIVGYWPLGGAYGQSDKDLAKNQTSLTATGSPGWSEHSKTIYPCECQCC